MPINLFPTVEFPIITVETAYYGADPSSVESKVTDKIEEALSSIEGLDKLLSTSYEGMSVVTAVFELERDITEAANDVREKVGSVILETGVQKPIVKKASGTSGAVISLFMVSNKSDEQALMRLADEKIKPRLQRIKGVGEINIVGFKERQIRILVDPFLLNKYRLSASDLQAIISKENLRLGGGKLVGQQNEFILKTRADASSLEEMKNIFIKEGVRLKDIAHVEDSLEDAKSYASYETKEGVMLEVKKISATNTLDIIKGVKSVMPELERIAGEDFSLKLLQDQSEKILQNINQVTFDLIYGAILSIIIVFLFLRNITATLLASLAIPSSIIGTFALMDWLGYDLNRLSMIGLTLAIGIFIDDAIVVIENITKKMEKGTLPFLASFEGIKEIAFSILAISAMLLAVFIPVAFMDGIVGRFFNSFAMTVASGVIISYIIAVMFIPSVAARILSAKESKFYHITEPFFVKLDATYCALLKILIRFKMLTILGTVGVLILSGSLLAHIGGDFVPMEDNAEMQIIIKAPVGINLEAMKAKMQPLLDVLHQDKLVEYSVLSIGYSATQEIHKAKIYVKIVPVTQRSLRQNEIVQRYREKFKTLKDLHVSVEEVPPMDTGMENAKVQIVITGDDLEVLEQKAKEVSKLLASIEGAVDVDNDFEQGKPEIKITIKRDNAMRLGVSAQMIAGIIGASFSSDSAISYFEEDGKELDVTLRFSNANRETIDDLKKLHVRVPSGEFVALEGLVNFEESLGAASINRYDRQRKVLVKANLFDVALDSIVKGVEENIDALLGNGYSYRFNGDVEHMEKTNKAFAMAVLLAIILIYLILAALYESLIQPFIIMVAMPLSFSGVVVALYLFGMPFSLFVMIGVILLLGMVGKNAILVVDFANHAIKEGKAVEDALLEAGEKRLRPILMTTFAMIGAMLPLALSQGAGHEGNAPMAIAIIGGLLSSTILTLLIVPVIYRLMYPLDSWLRSWYERANDSHVA